MLKKYEITAIIKYHRVYEILAVSEDEAEKELIKEFAESFSDGIEKHSIEIVETEEIEE
jgi:hypothetical protein